MRKTTERKVEVITRKNIKRVKQELEDSALRVWKTSSLIVPKMLLDFKVHFQEVYSSTVGKIFFFTPFWRGRVFTDGILMHEFLHWCFKKGTMIRLSNGYKSVENLKHRDRVISHVGETEMILSIGSRFVDKILKLKVSGCLPIECTLEHPFYTAQWKWKNFRILGQRRSIRAILGYSWKEAKDLTDSDLVLVPKLQRNLKIRSIDLKPYIKFPTVIHDNFPLNCETAELLGLYCAEGSHGKKYIKFSFSSEETDLIKKVQSSLKKLGYSSFLTDKRPEKKVIEVGCGSSVLARFLGDVFGDNAREKRVPEFIFHNKNNRIVLAFLKGFFDGDGHFSKGVVLSTASIQLALQIQALLTSFDTFASIIVRPEQTSIIRGKEVHQGKLYQILSSNQKVLKLFGLTLNRKRPTTHYVILDKYIGLKVKEKEIIKERTKVFNCMTEKNHSFTANNIAVHNSIYPVDLFQSLKHIFSARKLLADEVGFTPEIEKADLLGKTENWKKFPYSVKEFAFVQNCLGDYLINIHIHDYHPILFKELWKFLYHDGTFYEGQKRKKRDTTFMLYLSVYPELRRDLDSVKLMDAKTEEDRDKIVDIYTEVQKGRMSKVFALKELIKIFHKYLLEDARDKKGKGQGQREPKCPKCGGDTFEVTGYQDPKTGKWCDV